MRASGTDRDRLVELLAWVPSRLTIRFGLLVAALLGSGYFLWSFSALRFVDIRQETLALTACLDARPTDPVACAVPGARRNITWNLVGTTAVLVLAGIGYSVSRQWVIWRYHLVPLQFEDCPDVNVHIVRAFEQSGLQPTPQVYWNPLNGGVNGLAFGTGRRCIGLTGGLVALFYSRKRAFLAVFYHEVAHWVAGDVRVTYLTVSLGYAFALSAMLPALVGLIGQSLDSAVNDGARIVALGGLVMILRNAVLRNREFYADLLAAQWLGDHVEFENILQEREDESPSRVHFGLHPDRKERIDVLDSPSRLLLHNKWDALGAGIIAAVGFDSSARLMADITVIFRSSFQSLIGLANFAWYLPACIFGPLLACEGCTAAWRRAVMPDGGRRGLLDSCISGLVIGVGVMLGQQLGLASDLSWHQKSCWGFAAVAFINLGCWCILGAMLACSFAWHYIVARRCFQAGVSRRKYQVLFSASTISVMPLVIITLANIFSLRLFIDGPPLDITNAAQFQVELSRIAESFVNDIRLMTPRLLLNAAWVLCIGVPGIGFFQSFISPKSR